MPIKMYELLDTFGYGYQHPQREWVMNGSKKVSLALDNAPICVGSTALKPCRSPATLPLASPSLSCFIARLWLLDLISASAVVTDGA